MDPKELSARLVERVWQRAAKEVCAIGYHTPGDLAPEELVDGGTILVARCIYCGAVCDVRLLPRERKKAGEWPGSKRYDG